MWTYPADFEKKVAPRGYKQIREMTEAEKRLPKDERNEARNKTKCYVPCNSRATNIYRDRWALAYCCNMFFNPMIKGFFEDSGVEVSEDAFALACLVQWICRSRIRDDLPIEVYIPSAGMRKILTEWMKGA